MRLRILNIFCNHFRYKSASLHPCAYMTARIPVLFPHGRKNFYWAVKNRQIEKQAEPLGGGRLMVPLDQASKGTEYIRPLKFIIFIRAPWKEKPEFAAPADGRTAPPGRSPQRSRRRP